MSVKLLCSFVFTTSLLANSITSAQTLRLNDQLLLDHKNAVAKAQSTVTTESASGCIQLEALSKNSNHLLKAEARLHFFAYCDKNLSVDPFSSSEAQKIMTDYPWLARSATQLRSLRLLAFSKAQIDQVGYQKSIPIYLKAVQNESDRQQKIKLTQKIEHTLKSAAAQNNANTRSTIYSIVPRYILTPKTGEHLTIGKDFLNHGELSGARLVFENYLNANTKITAEAFEILKTYRDSYIGDDLNQDKFVELSNKTVTWASRFGETELYKARMRQVRNISFRDQPAEALKKLDVILRMNVTDLEKADAQLLVARVYELNNQFTKTIPPLEEAIRLGVTGELLNRVQFDLGRIQWKLKKYSDALSTFEKYRNRFASGSERAKGGFWMSRALRELGRTNEAQQVLAETRSTDKYGYYGFLAARELNQPLLALELFSSSALSGYQEKVKRLARINDTNASEITLEFLQTISSGKAPSDTHLYLVSLLKADQKDLFIETVRYFIETLDANKSNDFQVAQNYIEALQYMGHYATGFSFSSKLSGAARNDALKEAPELFYPAGFYAPAQKYSTQRGFETALTFSIIRQESMFNSNARSPVGAIGLMQLMPQTAASIAKELKIPNFDPKTLFNPSVNINFGTHLLDQLEIRFKGRFTAIVASYNGGPHNVDRWIKGSTAADEVEFVEDMVFSETRSYTKILSRNMAVYRLLIDPAVTKSTFPF